MRPTVFAVLMACGGAGAPPASPTPGGGGSDQPPPTLADDEHAIEAVLLHEIAAGGVTADETICVRVHGADERSGDGYRVKSEKVLLTT